MAEEPTGLRERTRRAVRGELLTVAMALFLEQGYEATTVEQISAAAGLSRRSFFRYFSSKDEILADSMVGTGESIAAAVATCPETETPWQTLRRAFDVLLAEVALDARARAMTRMVLQSPSMSTNHAMKETSWHKSIAAALSPRLSQDTETVLRADALTAAALACLTTAQTWWVDADDDVDLTTLLDIAMGAVEASGLSR